MSNKDKDEYKRKRENEVVGGIAGGIAGGVLGNSVAASGHQAISDYHDTEAGKKIKFGSDYRKSLRGMTHIKDIEGGAHSGGHSIYRTPSGKDIIITRSAMGNVALPTFSSRSITNDSTRRGALRVMRGAQSDHDIPGMRELDDYVSKNKGRQINLIGTTGNSDSLLHELGHTAGTRHGTASGALIRLNSIRPSRFGTKALASTGAMLTHRKAGESKEEYEERSRKNAIKSGLLGSSLYIPMLAEEARASLNANKLGKKLGVKVDNRRGLIPGYGTYVAGALTPTAIALGTHYGKRFVEREMEKKSSAITSKGDIHMGSINVRNKLLGVHENLKKMIGAEIGGAVGLAVTDSPIGILGGMVVGGVLHHYASTKGNMTKAQKEIRDEESALLRQMVMRKKKNK
jgi:hypothetical protein